MINLFKRSLLVDYSLYRPIQLFFLRLIFLPKRRLAFYEQLSALLKAEISLYDALGFMREKYELHKSVFKSFFLERKILDDLIYRLNAGFGTENLAEILKGLVPANDLVILSVDSRESITALDKIIKMIEAFSTLRSTLYKQFFTPISALFMVIILIFIANEMFFPIILGIQPFDQLPEATKNLYLFCHFFQANFIWIVVGIFTLITFVVYSLPNLIGSFRQGLDKLIPYNIYKKIQATNFLISLSLILQAGDDFTTAINKIKHQSNRYLGFFLERILNQIKEGDRSGEALSSIGLFELDTSIYIEILDQARALEKGLVKITERATAIQINTIKRLMGLISMLLLFAVIGFSLWLYVALGSVGLSL